MLNQYVARERVADWRKLAANRQLVASQSEQRRPRQRWLPQRPWRRVAAGQPVQA